MNPQYGEASSDTAVPANILAVASSWRAPATNLGTYDANMDMKSSFIGAVDKTYNASIGSSHKMVHSGGNKNGIQINCAGDENLSRRLCACALGLVAHGRPYATSREEAKISYCCLTHSPATCKLLADTTGAAGRTHGTYMKHMNMNSGFAGAFIASGKGSASALKHGVQASGGPGLNIQQARRHLQVQAKDTYSIYMKDLTELPGAFLEFQRLNPDGYFSLRVRPLSYHVKGAPANAKEFVSFMMSTGHARNVFWEFSPSKIINMDYAHRTARFGGSQISSVSRDSYGGNVRTTYGVCDKENKESWTRYTDFLSVWLVAVTLYLSDKDKGECGYVLSAHAFVYSAY